MQTLHYVVFLAAFITLSPAQAYDVQINVNGNIINTTCELDTASANLKVPMGDQPVSSLNTVVGATSPEIPFSIKLLNCSEAATGVNVAFSGTASGDASLLKIDDGGATGIGIEILDEDNNPIAINVASKNYPLIPSTNNTLNFFARYKTESLPVTAGDANASGTFILTYL